MSTAHPSIPLQFPSAPGQTPVRQYRELLLLPLRFSPAGSGPFSTDIHNINAMERALGIGDANSVWGRVKDASLPAVDTDDNARWSRYQHFAAVSYFHPSVRSFLFGSKSLHGEKTPKDNDFMRCYRRDSLTGATLTVTTGDSNHTLSFEVVRCDIALFQPDILVLQLELAAHFGEQGCAPLCAVQAVRDQLRRLYPPYFDYFTKTEENKPNIDVRRGGHYPSLIQLAPLNGHRFTHVFCSEDALDRHFAQAAYPNSEPPFGPHGASDRTDLTPFDVERWPLSDFWWHLLGLDAPAQASSTPEPHSPSRKDWIPPGDDRAPSIAYLAVDGIRGIPEGDWHRLAFADQPGSDPLPSSRDYMAERFKGFTYDRFWHALGDSTDKPSRILNCGYAFTYVGDASDAFFTNATNGALATYRQLYARMGLIAHFQKAALMGAIARLQYLAERDEHGKLKDFFEHDRHKKVSAFYAHFLEFTQVFWFDEVSPQEQGIELFANWQRTLRTVVLFDEIRNELRDLVQYIDAQGQEKQITIANRFTRTAAVLGGIGVVAGILGANLLPLKSNTNTVDFLDRSFHWSTLWLTVITSILVAIIGRAIYKRDDRRAKSEKK